MPPNTLRIRILSHDIWIRRRPEGRLAVYFFVTAGWEFPLLGYQTPGRVFGVFFLPRVRARVRTKQLFPESR